MLRELCSQIASGICDNPKLESLLQTLAAKLPDRGKQKYGYMSPSVKALIDRVVDALEQDARVAQGYDAWYTLRNNVFHTYTDHPPPKLPLSHQTEFKPIKNVVIQAALSLRDAERAPAEELSVELAVADETAPMEMEPPRTTPHATWTQRYKQARALLYPSRNHESDYPAALELLLRETESGNALAMHDLGRMYADGLGVTAEEDTAQKQYSDALSAFHQIESDMKEHTRVLAYLRYRIGKMYLSGLGTGRDDVEAARWLQKAADDGHKYAQYTLGGMYLRGQGVEQDAAVALELFQKSATQGNAYAAYALGKLYRDGVGTTVQPAEAERCFRSAYNGFAMLELESADDRRQYRLGQMRRDGDGVEKNPTEAAWYFEQAAERGNAFAQYALGKLYLTGDSVSKDISAAVEWLTRAAEQDNPYAQYQLGKLYALDRDVPRDRKKALHWLGLSAAQGNEYAQFLLEHIDELGSRDPNLAFATTNLLRQLGRIFENQQRQMQGQSIQIDRKRLWQLRDKKLAHGHAYDDREPRQQQ